MDSLTIHWFGWLDYPVYFEYPEELVVGLSIDLGWVDYPEYLEYPVSSVLFHKWHG